jgi:hypothetical protein
VEWLKWESTCLESVRPSVQTPESQKQMSKKVATLAEGTGEQKVFYSTDTLGEM